MGAFGWPHLLIILAVILLLFGAAKLPALAKSVGQSARVFKGEMKAMKDDDAPATTATPVVTDVPPVVRNDAPSASGGVPDTKD
ncbi:twin-arginine translocase TatA/TatE family subunit [Microbacterium sp. NPDC089189]|uniref:twin-arginine translocase TatA/TatE family subunit n=1 Tax=Microbacterium sp. NPDC089189 TaxID=3154972 RepID=UPI00341E13F2